MTGIAGAPRPRCHPALPPAALLAVLLVAVGDRYGPHGDELYFRMLPLRWWYDDQPPLTVWLTAAAGLLGDDLRLLRLPAVLAAVAGVFVAAAFPAALGAGPAARRLAAWAHAFTVYPLLMGHLFLTAALDFLAWQVIVLFALRATLGRPQALVGAGIVAGLACWNKLLVLVLVAALTAGLLLTDRALLRTRAALAAAAAVTVGAAPQLAAQLLHGLPTRQVSADLVTTQGTLVRAILIPATVVFLGPPLAPVWWRGLTGPWREADRRGRLLLPTAMIMLAWALVFPGQPYYAAPALFPALATGFARTAAPGRRTFSRPGWGRVVAANSAVSVLICLPVLPVSSPLLPALAVLNPTIPDQVGWPEFTGQLATARAGPGQHDDAEATVVTDTYALAGAVHRYGPPLGINRVASGHNALWHLGPPASDRVLLVGRIARTHRGLFATCRDAGTLRAPGAVPARAAGTPMARCAGPVGGWAAVWPRLRRLGG